MRSTLQNKEAAIDGVLYTPAQPRSRTMIGDTHRQIDSPSPPQAGMIVVQTQGATGAFVVDPPVCQPRQNAWTTICETGKQSKKHDPQAIYDLLFLGRPETRA